MFLSCLWVGRGDDDLNDLVIGVADGVWSEDSPAESAVVIVKHVSVGDAGTAGRGAVRVGRGSADAQARIGEVCAGVVLRGGGNGWGEALVPVA